MSTSHSKEHSHWLEAAARCRSLSLASGRADVVAEEDDSLVSLSLLWAAAEAC